MAIRCNICDRSINDPVWNQELAVSREAEGRSLNGSGGIEPCPACLEIIHDAVGSFRDRASVSEGELGDDTDLLDFLLLEEDDE